MSTPRPSVDVPSDDTRLQAAPTEPAEPAEPAESADGARGAVAEAARRVTVRRSAALLVLVMAAALVPLLGPPLALRGTGEAAAPAAGLVTFLRMLMFAALCVLVGESAAVRLARLVPGQPPGETARSWALYAAAVGALAAVGLALIVANGNLPPDRLAELQPGQLYGTTDGRLALLEVNAFAAAGFCARSRRPGTAALPLAAVVVAEALRAHPEAGPENAPLIGSALTLVHLTCAALWAGGLLQVLRTMRAWRRSRPEAGAALLGLYARVAAVLFAGITATGICSMLRKVPLDSLVTTAYGRVLCAKLLLVATIAGLAFAARRRLCRSADAYTAVVPARVEVIVLGVVVAVSALLTAVPAPIWWNRPLWG